MEHRFLKTMGMLLVTGVLVCTGTAKAMAAEGENPLLVTIEAEKMNVYGDTDFEAQILGNALQSEVYDVIEECDNEWVKITYGEGEAYVYLSDGAVVSEDTTDREAEAAREALVDYALQFVGNPYKYGGSDPNTGADCSGFVKYVLKNSANVSLPRSSREQAGEGIAIDQSQMRPGDLIFYGGKRISHVALYIGDGVIVHASTEKTGIRTENWDYNTPTKIVNVMGD